METDFWLKKLNNVVCDIMVKISIIIPVYNSEQYLEETITSVINQTCKDIEIICVNDGSTDSSAQILDALSKKYDCIRVLNQKNQGSGKARNYGMDEAKGEYIGFLDADDIFIDEKSLDLLYYVADKNNADMVCGNLKKLTHDRVLLDNPNCPERNYYCFDEFCTIEPNEYGVPWAFYKNIYKKSFLDENNIRFKDLIRGQDPVFLADILAKVDVVYGVPVDFYAYMFPVPGRPYSKVNTPTKKLHYITHYKDTFDIFEEAGLNPLSEYYKPKFIKYLNYSIKSRSLDIYDMVMDVFGKDNNYFVNFQDEYDYFRVFHILNKVMAEETQEYFLEAKEQLNKIDVFDNEILPKKLVENVELLNACKSFDDYKGRYLEFNLRNMKNETKNLKKKNERFQRNLKYRQKLLNRKFNLFFMKYNNLSKESKRDYYNGLKEDFISLKNHEFYDDYMENFDDFNKKFFESVINSQNFEEFDLYYENTRLDHQNNKLKRKLNDLIKENKEIANSKYGEELDNLIRENSELSAANRDLKIKFFKNG